MKNLLIVTMFLSSLSATAAVITQTTLILSEADSCVKANRDLDGKIKAFESNHKVITIKLSKCADQRLSDYATSGDFAQSAVVEYQLNSVLGNF